MRIFLLLCIFIPFFVNAQENLDHQITNLEQKLTQLKNEEERLYAQLEDLKLSKTHQNMNTWGLPQGNIQGELIKHTAMALFYSEKHEQAAWVAHMILPEVKASNFGRSNDFRPDPKVRAGSAVEQDYFLKILQADSTYFYDGFGYDRGHLAPSADFRWSRKALSESYFYSNMAPQLPELNRERWAELEHVIRAYVIRNNSPVFVVTGGVLQDGLPVIDRSINRVSIPKVFYKVVYDPDNQRTIGFLLPNRKCKYPLNSYACSVDSVEKFTGLNFFTNISEKYESNVDFRQWVNLKEQNDARPLPAYQLPRNHFNTVQARNYVDTGEIIQVCGKVVNTKLSSNGNVFLNLDKSFPNQIFTVSIFKDSIHNFSYAPEEYLKDKTVCFRGKVSDYKGTPSMIIDHEKDIEIWENK